MSVYQFFCTAFMFVVTFNVYGLVMCMMFVCLLMCVCVWEGGGALKGYP